jgi:hypothetical protein
MLIKSNDGFPVNQEARSFLIDFYGRITCCVLRITK